MKKILAIDDIMDNLITIKGLLKKFMPDCKVFIAQSGQEGIEIARKKQPDTILLDIIMPEMDGYTVCKKLKEDESTRHIPVIMLTAIRTDTKDKLKGLYAGADGFFSKPIEPEELSAQIKVMLRIKEAEDKLREDKMDLKNAVQERTKELRESEKRLRNIFENSTNLFYSHTPDHLLTYLSPQVQDILGYTQEEAKIKWTELASENPINKIGFKHTVKAIETGKQQPVYELELVKKNKEKIWVEVREAPVVKGGKTVSIVGAFTDITERKRAVETLRTSEAQLSNAMEIANLGYWEYDVDADLFTFNDHFYSIFRTTAKKAGGYKMSPSQYAERFLHPDDIALVAKETKKAIETTDPNFNRTLEHRIIYADGEIGYISVRFFIVKDSHGRTVKTYGANQDITERKRVEKELEKHRDHLEEMVEERTAELEVKNKELKRFNKLFIGREFRIKELKDKVKELEKAAGSKK